MRWKLSLQRVTIRLTINLIGAFIHPDFFPADEASREILAVKHRLGWQVRQIYHGTNLDRALPSYRNSSGDGNGFIKIHHVN